MNMTEWQQFFDEIGDYERREDENFHNGNEILEEARRQERVKAYDKLTENK